ncbi:radical SAM protein [Kiritimatiella glycovorans]|uniref:Anaerobic sulfatase-maturating enzyme n=1 Tax=Kiritimatiella glycovorans TaxID=1307763 RepID=A0A0G3EBV3_9BACT|nr:radical SAM protein [Kiritimatiella glycovorans]AKJ63783.1 Anaerobic sulfatase-maturating enzyme [Kiritimatiella glycovorans]
MNLQRLITRSSSKQLFRLMFEHRITRKAFFNAISRRLYDELVERNPDDRPVKVQQDKHAYLMALLARFDRAASEGRISATVTERIVDVFLDNVAVSDEHRSEAARRLGISPPLFVVISPTGQCNLRCRGCYAASDPSHHNSLDSATFERILNEKNEEWDSHFTVISGGEPFLWKDGDRDLLDVVEDHSGDLFLVYTNGTRIDDETARRMSELGNITPAISVEGFEAETDDRRGRGVFRKVLRAMENLRRHGVPFGISITPTKENGYFRISQRGDFDLMSMDTGSSGCPILCGNGLGFAQGYLRLRL